MTTLHDRPNAALVVIDMQRGVLEHAVQVDEVVANINALVDKARADDTPVVWVQHADDELVAGSGPWQLVDKLVPAEGDPIVHKRYGDSFEATNLEAVLAERGVGHLVITGAQTDACIRSTLHGALARGYDTTLISDAHATEDMRPWGSPISPAQSIAYTNMYWNFTSAPGRTCAAVAAADVDTWVS